MVRLWESTPGNNDIPKETITNQIVLYGIFNEIGN